MKRKRARNVMELWEEEAIWGLYRGCFGRQVAVGMAFKVLEENGYVYLLETLASKKILRSLVLTGGNIHIKQNLGGLFLCEHEWNTYEPERAMKISQYEYKGEGRGGQPYQVKYFVQWRVKLLSNMVKWKESELWNKQIYFLIFLNCSLF